MSELIITPEWPAAANIRACVSTRMGGVSEGGYQSLNLASHVGDDPARVQENRRRFRMAAGLPQEPAWLNQVHGVTVVHHGPESHARQDADACWTAQANTPCAVLTADCLPVLFSSLDGTVVAAAHAGWRGLCAGVLEATLQALPVPPGQMLAWLGPAIGPGAFEVGVEVREAFVRATAKDAAAFAAHGQRYYANLFALARARLQRSGVAGIYGGDSCTVTQEDRYFSHRRDAPRLGGSGRFASVIWRLG